MKEIKGLKIKYLIIFLLLVAAVLFGMLSVLAMVASNRYKKIEEVTTYYIDTQQDIYSLKDASDYLTLMARQYVVTADSKYARNYFEEVNYSKNREAAVDKINNALDRVGLAQNKNIEKALEKSNGLMDKEIYAMALIASISSDKKVSQELVNYSFSQNDVTLTGIAKKEKAYELVFGTDYTDEKESIDKSVSDSTNELVDAFEVYRNECTNEYNICIWGLKILLTITATAFAILAFAIIIFVLNPLAKSVNAIENDELIPPGKSYEINYLAQIYNEIYEKKALDRDKLQAQAERDALTGLLNRGSFESLKKHYSAINEKIAFLLIDVDNFKDVNDSYGHEIGDKALIRIAKLLEKSFRANDFPIRYGGDEFAVIMTGVSVGAKSIISKKVNYINDKLLNQVVDELPPLSISVGVSFSDNGFDDGMFERADKALYKTKENGRCGYSFDE